MSCRLLECAALVDEVVPIVKRGVRTQEILTIVTTKPPYNMHSLGENANRQEEYKCLSSRSKQECTTTVNIYRMSHDSSPENQNSILTI